MPAKIARFVGADSSGHAIYDVSPPIGDSDRIVAVHLPNAGGVGFYPPGEAQYAAWWDGDSDTRHALMEMGYTVMRATPRSSSDMVREFHVTFGHPVANEPGLIPDRDRALARLDWIQEEVDELRDAINAGDLVEIADALTDIKYLTEGSALEYGIPLADTFREVHASNMSKLGEDGKPVYGDDGKVAKGPNYREPRLRPVLEDAGWQG